MKELGKNIEKSFKKLKLFSKYNSILKTSSGHGFHFLKTVFKNVEFRHRFSIFEKKVWIFKKSTAGAVQIWILYRSAPKNVQNFRKGVICKELLR